MSALFTKGELAVLLGTLEGGAENMMWNHPGAPLRSDFLSAIDKLRKLDAFASAAGARIDAAKPEICAALQDAANHCSRCYGNGWLRRLPGNDRVPCEQCKAWRDALGKAVAP